MSLRSPQANYLKQSLMSRLIAGSVLVAALSGCGHGSSDVRAQATPVSSEPTPLLSVRYTGKWEFISHRHDGRFEGKSVRSFHSGDTITVVFSGTRFRIYGIRGANGGLASVVVPGKPPAQINFYAPATKTHVLLYDSGTLNGTIQTAGIVVGTPAPPRRTGYVNIDQIEPTATHRF